MKSAIKFVLGAAAALVTVAGAQAADLAPVAPVQYVRVCDAYGKGFFYIPGTQTCLQVSGLARMNIEYNQPFTRANDGLRGRVRARVQFDARSQTPWGTLRAYVRLQSDFSGNDAQHSNPLNGPGSGGSNPPANGVYVQAAYIQFAGLTAGLAQSFYDFIPFAFYNTNLVSDQNTLLVAYSASFGSGFTATLSAEDRKYRQQAASGAFGAPQVPGAPLLYAGNSMPDIVGALTIKQGWGAAQLSGAVRQLRSISPVAGTDYGFAIQAGVSVNLPMLAQGDKIFVVGAYADGALSYLGGTTGVEGTAGPLGGYGIVFDDAYVNAAGTGLSSATGFQVTGGLLHYWTPSLRSGLGAIYLNVDAPGTANDFAELTLVGNITWSPVPDLDLGLEVFNRNMVDHPVAFGAHSNSWGSIARIERRF